MIPDSVIEARMSNPLLKVLGVRARFYLWRLLAVDWDAGDAAVSAVVVVLARRLSKPVPQRARSVVREIRPGVIELDGGLRVRWADEDELEAA